MAYIIQSLLFVFTALAVFFGSHFFVYASIRHFFELRDITKWILAGLILFLSSSFILSSVLAHWYDNIFTRGFYYFSATWLWVLSNAFFIFAFLWIVSSLVVRFYPSLSLPVFGWIGITLVVFSTAYGIIQAANTIIREDTVYIENLPAVWEGKKIVQITDVHLGHIIRADFAQKIMEMTNSVDPAVVLIVGDLFDGMDGHLEGLLEPFNKLKSKYGTYFITGNHETYLGTNKTLDIVRKTNIKIIDNALVDLDWVQLVGVASPERWKKQDVKSILKNVGFNGANPSILMYHTPTEIDTFRSLGVSLQLAGHTHRGQLYPFNLITNLVFHGYDFWVYHEGKYSLSVSSWVGTWWPPMRTDSQSEIVVLTLTGKK